MDKQTNLTTEKELDSDSIPHQCLVPVKISLGGETFQGQLIKAESLNSSPPDTLEKPARAIQAIIHDINNNMTTILGNADLSLMQIEAHDDIYESINAIKKVGSKIQELLRTLNETLENYDSAKPLPNNRKGMKARVDRLKRVSIVEQPDQNRGCILVMDDKREVRSVVGRILIRLGYEVDTASDGVTTIEKYERLLKSGRKYDAVIMDVNIPGGFGAEETFKELLKIDPQVIAIVFSGCHNVGIMSNYDKFGFRGYVTKPFTVNELDRIVRQAIHGKGSAKSNYLVKNTFML